MESCGCPLVGGMYSSFVDWESVLSPWRVNETRQACVWKPFPVFREALEPSRCTLHSVHMCMPSLEGTLLSALLSRSFKLCSVPGAGLGGTGPPKERSPAYIQEYKKEKCPLEKTDRISFREGSGSCPNLLVKVWWCPHTEGCAVPSLMGFGF